MAPPAAPSPALLTVREDLFLSARSLRCFFDLTLHVDGRIVYREAPRDPPVWGSVSHYEARCREAPELTHEVLSRVGFAYWPEVLGEGSGTLRVGARVRDGSVRTCTLHVDPAAYALRLFDPALELLDAPHVALLAELLAERAAWPAAQGTTLRAAFDDAISLRAERADEGRFPSFDDRRLRRPALCYTQGNDGSSSSFELRVWPDGRGERRYVDGSSGYRVSHRVEFSLDAERAAKLFAEFAGFERRDLVELPSEHVVGAKLDTCHWRSVSYFDGREKVSFSATWYSERGLGSYPGPLVTAVQSRALGLLEALV